MRITGLLLGSEVGSKLRTDLTDDPKLSRRISMEFASSGYKSASSKAFGEVSAIEAITPNFGPVFIRV